MRALRFLSPGSLDVADLECPVAGAGEVLVAPHHVGLCGTDLELYTGSMPYLTNGQASYPIQPGHEVTGTVVASLQDGPPAGTWVLIDPVAGCGQCEACNAGPVTRCAARRELGIRHGMPGGAAELIAVPVANLHVVPDGVEARDAVLAEPGVTALNAIGRLGDLEGCRTLIVGAGTVGLIAAQLLLGRGAFVDVLVGEAAGRQREDLVDRIGARVERHPQECGYLGVIEAAGTPSAFHAALASVGAGGRVALVGVQGGLVDNANINEIVLKDVTVSGVLNGPGLYDKVLGEMAAGSLDASLLIDSTFSLLEAEAAMARLRQEKRPAPKVMLEIIRSEAA